MGHLPRRVLLYHEYSGVHTNLREGLRKFGVQADLLSPGDYYKGFKGDSRFPSAKERWRRDLLTAVFLLRSFLRYDVVQFMNSTDLGYPGKRSRFLGRTLVRFHRNTVLLASGCDTTYFRHRGRLAYSPCQLCGTQWPCVGKVEDEHDFMISRVGQIVPIAWDYERVYLGESQMIQKKLRPVIPMPVDIEAFRSFKRGAASRIKVLHPLNKPNKGTEIILEAFERLRGSYARTVDFVAQGRMPFEQFIHVLASADIVVDQATSYSYGMTGVFAMALGKVVLSGLEDEVRASRYDFYRECPVINIRPSVKHVEQQLRHLLDNPVRIRQLGAQGQKFAEQYHDCVPVAKRYLEVYAAGMRNRPLSAN